jgi:hypothetical protein
MNAAHKAQSKHRDSHGFTILPRGREAFLAGLAGDGACGGPRLLVNFDWMQDWYPLTVTQLRQTKEELAAMQERAEEISRLMAAGYGASDPKAIRAGELNSAIQRLQWELERSAGSAADATTA